MKFLCLVYGEESRFQDIPDEHCVEYDERIRAQGSCLASEALEPVRTAATVRVREGGVEVVDGPFAETKEQLAGFYLVDAPNIDKAVEIAAGIPAARVGCVEVRPVRGLPGRVLGADAG